MRFHNTASKYLYFISPFSICQAANPNYRLSPTNLGTMKRGIVLAATSHTCGDSILATAMANSLNRRKQNGKMDYISAITADLSSIQRT